MAIKQLDRRIQIRRGAPDDDGYQSGVMWNDINPEADNHGSPIWAAREDVSDAERVSAGWIEATLACRFTVNASSFTKGLTAKDRLVAGALVFDIIGVKETSRRDLLEITAIARADLG